MIPGLGLAAGILLSHLLFFSASNLVVPTLLAVLVFGLAFLAPGRRRVWILTAAGIGFLLCGIGTELFHRDLRSPRLTAADGEAVLLSGCVVNPPVFSPGREQFTVELAPKTDIRLSVVLKDDGRLALRYGDLVEAGAKVRSPRNFQNPDAFDFVSYLRRQNIFWTGSVANPADIRVLPGRCGSGALAWLFDVRTWALERIEGLYAGDQQSIGLLQATLLGETSAVERQWTQDFRVTGTYHALVISGQHISVLALTLLTILRLLRVRRIPALVVAALVAWTYALISGFTAPVVRAAGGFSVFLAASYCFRRTRILNVLALVGMIYLAFDPDQLFDPSFQLSFLSAAAIAVFAIPVMQRYTAPLREGVKRFDQVSYDPQLETRAAQVRVELRLLTDTLRSWTGLSEERAQWLVVNVTRLVAFLADAVVISACVQFGLALPMITYFHRISMTGLTANVIVVPLLSLVVPLGFASIVTGWHALAVATGFLLRCAEVTAGWHTHFEPSWRMAAIPVSVAVAFAAALTALAIAIRFRKAWAIWSALPASLALFGLVCFQPWRPLLRSGLFELTAIDVSQGDSLFVAFPDGETMLIDAGGYPGMERMRRKPQIDMGEDVVSPYLWSRRIRHLDYAVLTHGHSDHMAGLPAVLDNFGPRKLFIGAEPDSPQWRDVEAHAAKDGTSVVPLHRGAPDFFIGGVRIRVMAPSPEYVPGPAATNDDSLVVEMTYGKRSVLLTGDAEAPVEDEMLASGEVHPVTLLKVGHHGSKTSSTEPFVSALAPQFAIISDGYQNQFHHPHPVVLNRLAEHKVAAFRTDQRGLVTFLTDGDKVEIHTYR